MYCRRRVTKDQQEIPCYVLANLVNKADSDFEVSSYTLHQWGRREPQGGFG